MRFPAFVTPQLVKVYGISFFDGSLQTAIEFTLLLLLNHYGLTNAQDQRFYIQCSALVLFVPVLANIPATMCASRIGVARTLFWGNLIVAAGLFVMVFAHDSRSLVVLALTLYSLYMTLRVLRISLIARLVRPDNRTAAMAIHQLMIPVGAIFGPGLWLLCQMWKGSLHVCGLLLDRYTLLISLVGIINVGVALLARTLPEATEGSRNTAPEEDQIFNSEDGVDVASYGAVEMPEETQEEEEDRHKFVSSRLTFFILLTLAVRGASGFFQVALQPVLVEVFGATDAQVGLTYLLVAPIGCVTPLLVAVLTKYLQDRHILTIGLVIKVVGMALYLPWGADVGMIQVVAGFTLLMKGTMFFTTTLMSMLTKVLGKHYRHEHIGAIWTAALIGPAVAQIAFQTTIVPLFGTWRFAWFGLPAAASLGLVMMSPVWRWLAKRSA